MNFAVLHIEKNATSGLGHHIDRTEGQTYSYRQADPLRRNLNEHIEMNRFCTLSLGQAVNERIAEGYKGLKAIRKDAVKNLTLILSGSHERMVSMDEKELKEWSKTTQKWVADTFGKDNIVRLSLHRDEKTPHIHAVIVPITPDGRLNSNEWIGGGQKMAQLQSSYASVVADFGFERGIKSERKHHDTDVWYRAQEIAQMKAVEKIGEANKAIDSIGIFNAKEARKETKSILQSLVHNYEEKVSQIEFNASKKIEEVFAEVTYTAPPKMIAEPKRWFPPQKIKEKLNERSLLSYFNSIKGLGFTHRRGNEHYFGDPSQATGSIAVNDSTGVWFDHRTSKGGNLIEAIKFFEKKDYLEAINRLFDGDFRPIQRLNDYRETTKKTGILLNATLPLTHPALLNYTRKRGISDDIAKAKFKQVHYTYTKENGEQKPYFGLAWKNEADNWTVRNPLIKMNLGESDISVMKGSSQDLIVFEGYFDYLSYLEIEWKKGREVQETCIVLNSTNNIQKAVDFVRSLSPSGMIYGFLDNDRAGNEATKVLKEAFGTKLNDSRGLFKDFNDLNEFLQEMQEKTAEKEQKKGLGMER